MAPRNNACEHDRIKLSYAEGRDELVWQCCDCNDIVGFRRAAPRSAEGPVESIDVDLPMGTFEKTGDVWVRRPGSGTSS